MTDIVDRLKQVADLKSGDSLPKEFWDETNSWAGAMSALLYEAIAEIKELRRYDRR